MKDHLKQIENFDIGLRDWAILIMYRGSISHNMYIPNTDPNSIDDIDIMSVCIPSIDHYLGIKQYGSRGTREVMRNQWDIVVYEAHKFIKMLASGNPNVITMLWLKPEHYMKITPAGQHILAHRSIFACKHLYRSFAGYAHGQAKKMTSPNKKGYMGAKRKKLFAEFGYDVKNAAHLIRLLRMCSEFLKTGYLEVYREKDASELLEIKLGKWTAAHVEVEANRLFNLAANAYEKSTLPEKPDMDMVNQLCMDVVSIHHNLNIG